MYAETLKSEGNNLRDSQLLTTELLELSTVWRVRAPPHVCAYYNKKALALSAEERGSRIDDTVDDTPQCEAKGQ